MPYFEFAGSRAIYKDGWWACVKVDQVPWDPSPQTLNNCGPGSGYDRPTTRRPCTSTRRPKASAAR